MFEIFKELRPLYKRLTGNEIKVFNFFLSELNGNFTTEIPVSLSQIVKETTLSLYTIQKIKNNLKEKGYLVTGASVPNKGNYYGINFAPITLEVSKKEKETMLDEKTRLIAVSLAKLLQKTYFDSLTDNNKLKKAIQVKSNTYYYANLAKIKKALKDFPDTKPEDWAEEIRQRANEEYWLDKGLTFDSIQRNFGRRFEETHTENIFDKM